MFFKKKNKLRNKYDENLLLKMEDFKQQWLNLKRINDRSFSYNPVYEVEEKLLEIKYLISFREIKYRKERK